jgi:flagellar hook assembly protein FlgD
LTVIGYDLPAETAVSLRVFDLSGRHVRTLVAGKVQGDGRHQIVWDGRNNQGRKVAAGIYVCRLEAGGVTQTQRVTFVR